MDHISGTDCISDIWSFRLFGQFLPGQTWTIYPELTVIPHFVGRESEEGNRGSCSGMGRNKPIMLMNILNTIGLSCSGEERDIFLSV